MICLSSTVKLKNGEIASRIKASFAPKTIITVPRSINYYVITEFGVALMKGRTTWQRAEALINIAHPDFRDELIKEAESAKIWVKTNKQDDA